MPDPSAPMPEHVEALRVELLRQAKLGADSWRWYFAPFFPGLLLFNAGLVLDELSRPGPGALIITAFAIAFQGGFLAFLMRANRRAAAAMRAEVALLEA